MPHYNSDLKNKFDNSDNNNYILEEGIPCSLLDQYERFRGFSYFQLIIYEVGEFETSILIYQATWRHIYNCSTVQFVYCRNSICA